MRSRSIDYVLLLLGALLMLVSSYQLFFQQQLASQSKVLGELSSTLSVVKIKHALNLDWRDAQPGNGVSENELIFTNPEASAEVSFHEGGKLQIGENSLVRITTVGKGTGLDIEKGIIRAKLQGNKPFHVEMNGEDYELSGKDTEIQINLQEKKGEIGVISGNLTVQREGLREELTPTNLLSIEGKEVKKQAVPYKLTSPERQATLYTVENKLPVTFNWSEEDEATLLISQSPRMEKAETHIGRPGLVLDLAPGTHYWRVKSGKGASLVSAFKIVREIPIVVVRPLDGENINLLARDTQGQSVRLQWEAVPDQKYKVEWELDGSADSKIITGGGLDVEAGDGNELRWRVRIEEQKRPLALWSSWQTVKINRLFPPSMPTDISPDEVEYQTYASPEQDVELKWTCASPVELELISPKAKKEIKKAATSPLIFKAKEAGEYRFRVRAMDVFDRRSEWSEWKTFSIVDMSHEADQEAQKVQLKRPDQLVKFNWENDSGEKTLFELAKDQSFSDVVIKRELNGTETQTVIPEVGVYYWRSRRTRPDGSTKVSRPVKVIVEPAPAPNKPRKLPDTEVPIEWKVNEPKTTTWNILDLFISSAHADDITGMVKVEIPPDEDAKEFLIRIYKDEELTHLLVEKRVQGSVFEWEGARPGTYYWQYAIIDHWNRQSPLSDPAILTVTGKDVVKAEKPRLGSPIRAVEVEGKDLSFKWSKAHGAEEYVLEVSDREDFSNMLLRQASKENFLEIETFDRPPGLYYWRIKAINELKLETVSNTGRFKIRSPIDKVVEQNDIEWKKMWRRRASLAWAPSKDSYSFKDGNDKGEINGQALNGVQLKGTEFLEKWILGAELLRQSGKVYEGQDYLFQRLLIDGGKNFTLESGTRLAVGVGLGHTTGQAYEVQNSEVKASANSGVSYGPVFRSFHPFSKELEVETRILYFLGTIKQLEASVEILRHWKEDYYFVAGLSYARREYDVGEGEQTSLRGILGLGKEFY